jgi:hypothetical protein
MVGAAVGEPAPGGALAADFAALIAELDSGNAARIAAATNLITTRFFLTLPSFRGR